MIKKVRRQVKNYMGDNKLEYSKNEITIDNYKNKEIFEIIKNYLEDLNEIKESWKSSNLLKTPSEEIKDIKEKAYQRALFNFTKDNNESFIYVNNYKLRFIDYEFPVEVTKNSRRRCADLIGKAYNPDSQEDLFTIVELKFKPKEIYTTSLKIIIDGIKELIEYERNIVANLENLEIHDQAGNSQLNDEFKEYFNNVKKDGNVKKSLLIFCANASFWNSYMKEQNGNSYSELIEFFEFISKKCLRHKFNLLFTKCDDINFEEQKNNLKYIPKLPDDHNKWEVIFPRTHTS